MNNKNFCILNLNTVKLKILIFMNFFNNNKIIV